MTDACSPLTAALCMFLAAAALCLISLSFAIAVGAVRRP